MMWDASYQKKKKWKMKIEALIQMPHLTNQMQLMENCGDAKEVKKDAICVD